MVPQLWEWAAGLSGKEEGEIPSLSQGCQWLGAVSSQSPADVGAWGGQACHSLLCLQLALVSCVLPVCSPAPPVSTSFIPQHRKQRDKGPRSWSAQRQDPAGRGDGGRCENDSLSLCAALPPSGWLGQKSWGSGLLCGQEAVEVGSRSPEHHLTIPESATDRGYWVGPQGMTAGHRSYREVG